MGQVLLPGNVVYVPLLGAQVLGVLQAVADTAQQQQEQQQLVLAAGGQQSLSLTQPLLQVTSSTQVQMMAPDERQSGLEALQAAFGHNLTATHAAAAAAGAGGASSSDQGAVLQQRISLAREAAAAAVDSSAQQAAMEAAERAVRAGGTPGLQAPLYQRACTQHWIRHWCHHHPATKRAVLVHNGLIYSKALHWAVPTARATV
jgi:hypothetical protein